MDMVIKTIGCSVYLNDAKSLQNTMFSESTFASVYVVDYYIKNGIFDKNSVFDLCVSICC